MYLSVIEVEPNKDKKLLLTFENGEKRIFDMKEYLEYGVFQELKDESIFNSVHIAFDSIEWANGIDFDPEVLYEKSSPVNL